jgi:Lipocalin-like domain
MEDRQDRNALVGAWRLVSWENRADGQVTYPMGTDPLGYLLYTADGCFSVTISRAGRARFAAGDLLGGTPGEKAGAVEGFVAYAGRYSFYGDRVVHHVELSLFPNWVGTHQERFAELSGDRLTLSASPLLLAGKQQVPHLVWERADPSPSTGRPQGAVS